MTATDISADVAQLTELRELLASAEALVVPREFGSQFASLVLSSHPGYGWKVFLEGADPDTYPTRGGIFDRIQVDSNTLGRCITVRGRTDETPTAVLNALIDFLVEKAPVAA